MITLASQQCSPDPDKDIPISQFNTNGSLTFMSHVDGHFIWDVDSSMCHPDCDCDWDDDSDDECYSSRRRKKKIEKFRCKPQTPPRRPHQDLTKPLPIYRKALKILEKETPVRPIQPCMMFAFKSQTYNSQFPPLGRQDHPDLKTSSRPYVRQKEVMLDGSRKSLTQEAEVLNWQTLNSQAQNQMLTQIDTKLDRVAQTHITDARLADKETEIRRLKKQLKQIDDDLDRQQQSTHQPVVYSPPALSYLIPMFHGLYRQPAAQSTQSTEPIVEEPMESTTTNAPPPPHLLNLKGKADGVYPTIPMESILKEFSSKFISTLHNWFQSLGEYKQLQLLCTNNPQLNGIDEPNIKQVFTSSLLDELQNEIQNSIDTAKKDLKNITIGQIH
ncbi:hypothetical protein FNV43_RR16762 [Rhamnella rubrinervis]|uniref:Uncharacterized protein n=1 Tax=Rhamnella rubrinervis TaxID=2594499 RepID=A0A8K0GZD6_9ROSA|nr:hypothetical protein FNV43_RR16762 [Rhamnella rubrinervis]